MKLVIQRVNYANVKVGGQIIGEISQGFLVFLGISDTDTKEMLPKYVDKLVNLRIFADEEGKTNLSLANVGGELLVVSQFTLYADCKKGNRPSFTKAGNPAHANNLYEEFVRLCKEKVNRVETGSFGADMKITLENDGPFTIIWDSNEW